MNQPTSTTIDEAERGVLSSLINATSHTYIEKVRETLRPEDFKVPGHADLYTSILSANDQTNGKDRSPSMVMVQAKRLMVGSETIEARLTSLNIGLPYLQTLQNLGVSEASGALYMEAVNDSAINSRIYIAGNGLVDLAKQKLPGTQAISESEKVVGSISDRYAAKTVSIQEVAERFSDAISGIAPLKSMKVKTGLRFFDDIFGGLHSSKIFVIGAAPSNGKSAVARSIALHAALANPNKVAILDLAYEDGEENVGATLLSTQTGPHAPWSLAGVPQPRRRIPIHIERLFDMSMEKPEKPVSSAEILEVQNAKERITQITYEVETAARKPSEISPLLRRFARNNPGKLLVVLLDYLTLASPERPADNRETMLADLMAFQRSALANELQGRGCWIDTSQLNRTNGTNNIRNVNASSRPTDYLALDSLLGGATVEQAADGVMFLLKPEQYPGNAQENPDCERIAVDPAKNKITRRFPKTNAYIHTPTGLVTDDTYH